jgi:ATP-dependent RNA helicase RhlE
MGVRRALNLLEQVLTNFSSLNLAEPIAKAVAAEGYSTPTPIQAQAIPPVLAGKDLLGIAQTGTGKTAAFALPILDRLARNPAARRPKSARVLVLAPTRELAAQIAASFFAYGRFIRVGVATVFGGVPINRQIRELHHGVDVLVATPGRLIDLIDRKAVNLSSVEVAVLDEADRMLDLGFIPALRRIMPLLPKSRQTLLFSATMPKAIAALAGDYQKDPVRVAVAPVATTAERVEQFATFVRQADKQALLTLTLQDSAVSRALIFTRTKHGADKVVRSLEKSGLRAAAIHGNKSQPQREKALEAFRAGRTPFLVATDIAARGLDIDAVSHVINYERPGTICPQDRPHSARRGRWRRHFVRLR